MKKILLKLNSAFAPVRNFANALPNTKGNATPPVPPKGKTADPTGGKGAPPEPPPAGGGPGKTGAAPVPGSTGDTFDFQKMLLQLLGLPTDAAPDAIQNAFNSCMATEPSDGAQAIKGSVDTAVQGQQDANAGKQAALAEAHTAVQKLAGAQQQNTQLAQANEALVKRCELAEGAFATERNAHVETMCNAAVITGRMTKAEATNRKKKLLEAETPAEWTMMVNEVSALPVKLSQIHQSMELERTMAPGTASDSYMTMVNEAMAADKSHNYDWHWNNTKKTEKGKAAFDAMRQPHKPDNFSQKPEGAAKP